MWDPTRSDVSVRLSAVFCSPAKLCGSEGSLVSVDACWEGTSLLTRMVSSATAASKAAANADAVGVSKLTSRTSTTPPACLEQKLRTALMMIPHASCTGYLRAARGCGDRAHSNDLWTTPWHSPERARGHCRECHR